jgi:TonB family protein
VQPEKFGRYEVQAELGDGAMGRVYRAWDPSVSRIVAVKTVKHEYLTSDTTAEYMRRFRREAQAAGSLSHPSIVRVYDVGEDYLVMEFVDGRTLQQVLRDEGRFEPAEALRLLGPIADAVDHAHRAGIIHRDIKPANIMVQRDGQPKLMDFGVAHHLEASVMTTAGQILGSPSYMSPEQIAGQEVTGRSDVYSLAVVAYEMLTGLPPFQGTITQVIYRVMNDAPPPPRLRNAGLPPRYDDVFAQALEKDPAKRFATAGAFVSALDVRELELQLTPEAEHPARSTGARPAADADAQETILSSPPGKLTALPPAGAKSRGRNPLLIGGALVAVVAVAAGAWWVASRPAANPAPTATVQPSAAASDAPSPSPTPTPVVTVAASPDTAATASPAASPSAAPTPRAARVHAKPTPTLPPTPPPTPPPAVEGQLVEMGPGVTAPVKLKGDSAPYPEKARRQHLQGTVAVSVTIDETGQVRDPQIVESAGAILDEAVLASLRDWRFEPARKDGVKVKLRWLVRQTYKIGR